MHRNIHCPACQKNSFSPVFPVKDFIVSNDVFEIIECGNCQIRLTYPFPQKSTLDNYYESENYMPHSETSAGITGFLYRLVQKFMVTRKQKLVEKVSNSSSGKLLDVGCGTGEFLNEMRRGGWEIDGIDQSEHARRIAQKRHGITSQPPTQLHLYQEGEFDVITFWHVLEHLTSLTETLQLVYRALKTGGTLLIAAPNYKSFDGDYYQMFWAAYDVPRHLYHFSYDSVAALLEQAGLSISHIRRLPFDSFYISMLSETYKQGNIFRGLWIGLRSYLQSLSNSRRCSSIIYITQKK